MCIDTVRMMHIKTRLGQVGKQPPPPPRPPPERRQVLINGGPGRDHELGISPPPHVLCAVYAPDPCMTQDTLVGRYYLLSNVIRYFKHIEICLCPSHSILKNIELAPLFTHNCHCSESKPE